MVRTFLLIMIVVTASFAVHGDTRVSSRDLAPTECVFLQDRWSAWGAMPDQNGNGIDLSWQRGRFKYDDGNYEVFWRLRNRYRKAVAVTFILEFMRANGSTFRTTEVQRVGAGEIESSIGQFSIAYSLEKYGVRELKFEN